MNACPPKRKCVECGEIEERKKVKENDDIEIEIFSNGKSIKMWHKKGSHGKAGDVTNSVISDALSAYDTATSVVKSKMHFRGEVRQNFPMRGKDILACESIGYLCSSQDKKTGKRGRSHDDNRWEHFEQDEKEKIRLLLLPWIYEEDTDSEDA